MAGLLSKLAAKKVAEPKAAKKSSTVWMVGAGPETEKVAASVRAIVSLSGQAKSIEAQLGVHKGLVKEFSEGRFAEDYARVGVLPETPMNVQTPDGVKVTFVVQDRGGQYDVKEDQKEALEALLGADAAADLLYTETTFSFSRNIMMIPGVSEAVEKALERVIAKLTDGREGAPILTVEAAEELLDVKTKTAFKPGTLDRIGTICGRSAVRIEQFLEAMGSGCTRYIKS